MCELCILKSVYPYFFDTQTKVPFAESNFGKIGKSNTSEGIDEDTIVDDNLDDDNNLSEEETYFVKMRESITMLVFEMCLKLKNLEPILLDIIGIGKRIIDNDEAFPIEDVEYRLEATLDVFHHFLEGIRDSTKIANYEEM